MSSTMPLKTIPITRPSFGFEEEKAVMEVLRSGWVSQGPRVAQFEKRFAEYVGAVQAVAVSSCTTALHLALLASRLLAPTLDDTSAAHNMADIG